ncbi:hypothetical protein J2S92_003580 [Arthrobacter bambusae]|nr:hypothetical protein [Arthrobacter bambusae]MDQ0212881.1 hypothetical protein [Arthrobacter bambusae]MDQ0237187.1 hypothetical protein [Arthrobacter bambusae]
MPTSFGYFGTIRTHHPDHAGKTTEITLLDTGLVIGLVLLTLSQHRRQALMTEVDFNEESLDILIPRTGSEFNIKVRTQHLRATETVYVWAASLLLRSYLHYLRA